MRACVLFIKEISVSELYTSLRSKQERVSKNLDSLWNTCCRIRYLPGHIVTLMTSLYFAFHYYFIHCLMVECYSTLYFSGRQIFKFHLKLLRILWHVHRRIYGQPILDNCLTGTQNFQSRFFFYFTNINFCTWPTCSPDCFSEKRDAE